MSSPRAAAHPAKALFVAAVLAFAGGLPACGTDGGISTDLPPGPPTAAPPGTIVLYAAMSKASRIDAYRLGADGLMPAKPFDFVTALNPRRVVVHDGVLYATLFDRVVSYELGPDGSLPSEPTSTSNSRGDYDPVDMEVRDGILYVAAQGLGRVESYELEPDGSLPEEPTGSGFSESFADYVSLELFGDYLYSAARTSQFVDVFLLEEDGNVPTLAEPQSPQDRIALGDDIVVRDGVLYVTSASDKSIRAYIIEPNGFLMGEEDSRTRSEEYYADILLDGDILYGAAYNAGRIDLYTIDPDGMLPELDPYLSTQDDPASYPSQMILNSGVLYVAQAGLDRLDAYVLDSEGRPSAYPTSSTDPIEGSLPLGLALYDLD